MRSWSHKGYALDYTGWDCDLRRVVSTDSWNFVTLLREDSMSTISVVRQPLKVFLLTALLLGTTACAATVTALKYKDLEVQSKLSETIFLDPMSADKKTLRIDVKNTSDQDVDLSALTGSLSAKGYRVVSDPNQAQYLLQANVLYVGKASDAATDQALGAGYGGPLAGIVVGGIAGAGIGQSPAAVGIGAAAGGLIGGAVEVISGALVKAVMFTVITDVQLSERSDVPVAQEQTA
jgi:hypothetical protein